MALNLGLILSTILADYALPWDGDHGVAHWARVLENGLRLAGETGANVEVVQLFAILHDARRVNEGSDPDHGPRAAAYALELRGLLFDLSDSAFRLRHRACAGHTPTSVPTPISPSSPAGTPTDSISGGSGSRPPRAGFAPR